MTIEFYEDHILDTEDGRRYALSCPFDPTTANTHIPEYLRRAPKPRPVGKHPALGAPYRRGNSDAPPEKTPEEIRQEVREWRWQKSQRRR